MKWHNVKDKLPTSGRWLVFIPPGHLLEENDILAGQIQCYEMAWYNVKLKEWGTEDFIVFPTWWGAPDPPPGTTHPL